MPRGTVNPDIGQSVRTGSRENHGEKTDENNHGGGGKGPDLTKLTTVRAVDRAWGR